MAEIARGLGRVAFHPIGTHFMDKAAFSQRLLIALGQSNFDLDVSAIKMLNSTTWLPRVPGVYQSNLDGAAKAGQLKGEFDDMQQFYPLLAFKFLLGQPIVLCSLDGDALASAEMIAAAEIYDACTKKCLPYTLKPHGTVTGVLLYTFFDAAKAKDFVSNVQQACRYKPGFGQFTSVRPWAADVSNKTIVPEQKTWLNALGALAGFSPNQFQKRLFGR